MNLFDVVLKAGIDNQVTVQGRYFRILSGSGRVRINASNGKQSDIITGIGVDIGGFEWFRLRSATDQTVTVLVSDLPTTDSRLTGDVDINGLLSVVNLGGSSFAADVVTMTGDAAIEVLPNNSSRLSGNLQPSVDMYIGPDNSVTAENGLLVGAGSTLTIENTGPLFAYSVEAGTVRKLESIK